MSNPFNRAIDAWVSVITPKEDCHCRCEPRYYREPEAPPLWLLIILYPVMWLLRIVTWVLGAALVVMVIVLVVGIVIGINKGGPVHITLPF